MISVREWRCPYEKIRPAISPGDLIAFHGVGVVSRGIAIYEYFRTRTPIQDCITHVAIASSGPDILDRKLMIEADEGEVNPRSISATLKSYNGRAYWYPLKDELKVLRPTFDLCCWEQVGIKYDFTNLFKNLTGNVSLDIRRFFCSELAQFSLQAIPNVIINEILRKMKKTLDDFPELDLFFAKKALRPNQLVKLPFYKPRIEIILPVR